MHRVSAARKLSRRQGRPLAFEPIAVLGRFPSAGGLC